MGLTLYNISVPTFRFNVSAYIVMENMGPAVVAIELVDKMLHFDIAVSVVDVTGGTATGETLYSHTIWLKQVS